MIGVLGSSGALPVRPGTGESPPRFRTAARRIACPAPRGSKRMKAVSTGADDILGLPASVPQKPGFSEETGFLSQFCPSALMRIRRSNWQFGVDSCFYGMYHAI